MKRAGAFEKWWIDYASEHRLVSEWTSGITCTPDKELAMLWIANGLSVTEEKVPNPDLSRDMELAKLAFEAGIKSGKRSR